MVSEAKTRKIYRFRDCKRKKVYINAFFACIAVNYYMAANKTVLAAYKCRYCPNWHLAKPAK